MNSCENITGRIPQKEILKQEKIMHSWEDIKEESNPHKEILKQFRKNLSDILTPDVTDKVLLKWLRAKNFNLRKCEEIYRTNLMTRAVLQVDKLEEIFEEPEVIQKYRFSNFLGIAKDGTPIRYIAVGRGDLKGFVMSLDIYSIGRHCAKETERDLKICKEQSKKLGKEINEITYIVDMSYFAIGQAFFSGVTEVGLDLIRLMQDHYPEIWNNILVVNAPFYFQTLFNIFKPILRHTILQKIHVVSRDRTASLLLKYIDEEVLPMFLGGKRVDSSGNPMCPEFMKFGGIIPEKYYLRNRTPLNPTDFGVEDVWIQPKSCHNISIVVREADSTIRVELRTEGGSIYTGMLYRKFGPDPEDLDLPGRDEYLDPGDKKFNVEQCTPFLHLQTHISPIDAECLAPWPGIYIFRLDNSYNWLTHRRCIYRFRVLPPDAH